MEQGLEVIFAWGAGKQRSECGEDRVICVPPLPQAAAIRVRPDVGAAQGFPAREQASSCLFFGNANPLCGCVGQPDLPARQPPVAPKSKVILSRNSHSTNAGAAATLARAYGSMA